MRKINLVSTYYISDNPMRKQELDFCKEKNMLVGFDNIIFWENHNIPTFNNLFEKFKSLVDQINIIANADIYFLPESLERIKLFFDKYGERKDKLCLALTRWEYREDGNHRFTSDKGSQDTWCFFGNVEYNEKTDFELGTPGCDNRIVAELRQSLNYHVVNPSLYIKTIHYHPSGNTTRTYMENGKRIRKIDGPYETVEICDFES